MGQQFNHSDLLAEFRDYGLNVKALGPTGRINRCADIYASKRNDNGWYLYQQSGDVIFAVFGSWSRGDGTQKWNSRGEFEAIPKAIRVEFDKLHRQAELERADGYEKTAKSAHALWNRALPVENHAYLTRKGVQAHGIRVLGTNLLIPVRSLDGDLQSYQTISLQGQKRFATGGKMSGGSFCIGETADADVIAVAEGYATAATIYELTGWPVIVTFSAGSMKKLARRLRKKFAATLIFCGDNDESGAGQKASRDAAQAAYGVMAIPDDIGDWNDYSALYGPLRAKEKLLQALPRPMMHLRQAEAEMKAKIDAFIRDMAGNFDGEGLPPTAVVKITPGVGKTYAVHRELPKFVGTTGKTVAVAVPSHKLGEDQLSKFSSADLSAGLWRGLSRPDPSAEGELMCRDFEFSKAGLDAGLSLKDICKVCPLSSECGYRKQASHSPQVLIFASEMLFRPPPGAFSDAGLLILDEDITRNALASSRMAISTLEAPPSALLKPLEKKALEHLRSLLIYALKKTDESRELRREDLDGLTAEMADTALELEEITFGPLVMPPGDRDQRMKALRSLAGKGRNRSVPLLWRLVRDFLRSDENHCPTIDILPYQPIEGGEGTVTKVAMRYRRNIHPDWAMPTLALDATADIRLIKQILPAAEMLVDIDVEARHQKIIRVTEKSFAKASMLESDSASETDNKTRQNTLKKLRQVIEVKAAMYSPALVGVILNKAVEDVLGSLPPNVWTDHFNNTKGRNDWENAAALVIVGRTKPDRSKSQKDARAFSGTWDCDELTDAMAWQICEAELLQNIGRARGVRRTKENPVDVYLLNDIELPVRDDVQITWKDFQPTPLDLMAARGVILDVSTSTRGFWPVVWAVLPDLFANKQAAQDHGQNNPLRWNSPMGDTYIGGFYRKDWLTAEVRAGTRGWIPVRIDPRKLAGISELFLIRNLVWPPVSRPVRPNPTPIPWFIQPNPRIPTLLTADWVPKVAAMAGGP